MTIDCIALKKLIWALNNGNYKQKTLQQICGLSNASMARWMKMLRGRVGRGGKPIERLIYIESWTKSGNQTVPVYTWGIETPDAPRPPPMTPKQYNERARIKYKLKQQTAAQKESPN